MIRRHILHWKIQVHSIGKISIFRNICEFSKMQRTDPPNYPISIFASWFNVTMEPKNFLRPKAWMLTHSLSAAPSKACHFLFGGILPPKGPTCLSVHFLFNVSLAVKTHKKIEIKIPEIIRTLITLCLDSLSASLLGSMCPLQSKHCSSVLTTWISVFPAFVLDVWGFRSHTFFLSFILSKDYALLPSSSQQIGKGENGRGQYIQWNVFLGGTAVSISLFRK